MRRLSLFVAAILLVACGGGKETPEKPSVVPAMTLSPQTINLTAAGTPVSVNISSNVAWTATPSSNWVSVSTLTGTGNATIQVSATANTGALRKATVTFTDKDNKLARTLNVNQSAAGSATVVPAPDAFDGTKRSDLTYQLLVYSFCDSDGDGWGDFNGIRSKLDYLDEMGVTALWLSPAHPTSSYHGYDVNDYSTLNPLYGSLHTSESAEADFALLCQEAKAKGIDIYMDYVLNHSGRDNPWFQSAISSPDSPYASYYVLSQNPSVDVADGKIDNFAGASNPGMGSWHSVTSGGVTSGRLHFCLDWSGSTKKITVSETTEAAQQSNTDTSVEKYIYFGNNKLFRLYATSANIYEITVDYDSSWGFLVRTSSTSWAAGTKYGVPSGGGSLTLGTAFDIAPSTSNFDPSNIAIGGFTTNYFASFDASMPDLNYGKYQEASESEAFQAIAATVDKWIGFGIAGLRLDAVIWIYQPNVGNANPEFLRQWYERCNTAYHNAGHSEDFFMVGETWLGHSNEKEYYKGLPSCFEFDYWGKLTYALNNKVAMYFAKDVMTFINSHKNIRSDAITSIFLTNHDQDRAAEGLDKNLAKEKQAAALLLTSTGKPFIYQGEELGYWGTKGGGDEYVRTPIKWTKTGNVPTVALGGKVDNSMLTSSISVEAQKENDSSLLNVYKAFARVRNTYHALAKGTMKEHGTYNSNNTSYPSIGCWYMEYGTEKMLVVHNTETTAKTISLSGEDLTKPVALLGTASIAGSDLTLGGNSSVIFKLY